MQSALEKVTEIIATRGLTVVGAVVVLVVGMMVAKIIRRGVTRSLTKGALDETLVPFVSNLVYYTLVAFVVIAVITMLGIPTTSFIAVLGAAGLAVGLALQGTLSSFAAGVMLLVFRPFRVGDYVEAGGTEGVVTEVGVFATSLDSLDNVHIVLPNAAVWGQTIKNFTSNAARRNDMTIGVSYTDDIARAKEVILQTLKDDPRVLEKPAPLVAVQDLGESSVDFLVGPWCEPGHYWDLRFDLFEQIKGRLEANGCTIPFPQRDVHLFQEKTSPGAS
jgi:small conductance mechanosensitive channel